MTTEKKASGECVSCPSCSAPVLVHARAHVPGMSWPDGFISCGLCAYHSDDEDLADYGLAPAPVEAEPATYTSCPECKVLAVVSFRDRLLGAVAFRDCRIDCAVCGYASDKALAESADRTRALEQAEYEEWRVQEDNLQASLQGLDFLTTADLLNFARGARAIGMAA